jgi:predicted dehydrogenase
MIGVGIIGCGKQADAHVSVIKRLEGVEIVGVCDSEILMAKQLAERANIRLYFNNVEELLKESKPSVVHIITPPHSHLTLGKLCLDSSCHAFFEKPFGLNRSEAEELISLAREKGLKLTIGHNNQFNPATMRMRKLVSEGFLGGGPLHLESIWGYDLTDPVFAKALLGDKTHWVRGLPGKLLHNIINHGIAKIAEFLKSDNPLIIAHGFTSPTLMNIGEAEIIDELRVIIDDKQNTTAYFTFSSQIKPLIRQLRLFGLQGGMIVDDMHQTVTKVVRTNYKSYLNYFVPPLKYSKQYSANFITNLTGFLRRKIHLDLGRRHLIGEFYKSIIENTPPPIPYREILLTSRIMDSIFDQIAK